ncbi:MULTISPECIES: ATP-grasp domain-containing protein [unclassified Polaribacter]|uniref:ATP-grasp domain-containing protein n=1 Tax=unclassified Polaribacter TaxID=196858 RepID=UPI0011BD50ED|nr:MULTISPECIES: ATP-grasp domain-containing protein [unclassified Polaribacter]TXD53613.1 ATP-grasp domain-containing protein [Polaribacter sp. IC063]TXD62146.1 ATP-grasp domain-containing protein [Polaribacter sp. IC066]
MILIDYPFVSDFLIKTIKDNNFEIIATKEAKSLINDDALNWISESDAKHTFLNSVNPIIYTNSENSLPWIFKNLKSTNLPEQIKFFKDKFAFRELTAALFPDFLFRKIKIEEIQTLNINEIKLPFVIKPSLGFFSIGVHIIHNELDWNTAKKELNYETLKSIYPKDVMDASTFIIEEYIEGEEFAIDAYFNADGEVVILNILHHKFSSSTDVSDRVYSTSQSIIRTYKESIENFLKPIGKKAALKNFPLHLEVRIDKNNVIKPIEINPQRFGGWCTTGDLSFYAFGFNSYQYLFLNKKPNWDAIFKNDKNEIYSIILLNNNSGIKPSEIASFDFNMLAQDLENIVVVRELDFKKYPAFGLLFIKTSEGNEKELNEILNSDLAKYITKIN